MSFLSIVGRIGHFIVSATPVVSAAAPMIELIPGVGSIFGVVLAALIAAEKALPAGTGAEKKVAATSMIDSLAPGSFDPVKLSAAIDNTVAALNALTVAMSGITTSPKPTP